MLECGVVRTGRCLFIENTILSKSHAHASFRVYTTAIGNRTLAAIQADNSHATEPTLNY